MVALFPDSIAQSGRKSSFEWVAYSNVCDSVTHAPVHRNIIQNQIKTYVLVLFLEFFWFFFQNIRGRKLFLFEFYLFLSNKKCNGLVEEFSPSSPSDIWNTNIPTIWPFEHITISYGCLFELQLIYFVPVGSDFFSILVKKGMGARVLGAKWLQYRWFISVTWSQTGEKWANGIFYLNI